MDIYTRPNSHQHRVLTVAKSVDAHLPKIQIVMKYRTQRDEEDRLALQTFYGKSRRIVALPDASPNKLEAAVQREYCRLQLADGEQQSDIAAYRLTSSATRPSVGLMCPKAPPLKKYARAISASLKLRLLARIVSEPRLARLDNSLGAVGHLELIEDIGDVIAHGLAADVELAGNLRIT
jgi:hypothetical protein